MRSAPVGARGVARPLGAVALALGCALVATGEALAAGGTSIAAAPVIQSGVQQAMNSSSDATVLGSKGSQNVGCWIDYEYWRLPLTAGDQVAIGGILEGLSTNFEVGIFPPGTTDASIVNAKAVTTGFPNPGHMVRFTAGSSGTYVLLSGPNCYNGNDGPFAFTVTVTPGAVASGAGAQQALAVLPAITHLPTSGALAVNVHTSSGTSISDAHLVLELYGTWKNSGAASATAHLLATASPRNGSARFSFHLPASLKGTTIKLRVVASASSGYQAVSSAVATVAVT